MPEKEKVQALILQLALMEKECPKCGGSGTNPPVDRGLLDYDQCPVCHGSGKVPLLEGVREKCPRCDGLKTTLACGYSEKGDSDYHTREHGGGKAETRILCLSCRGRGFVSVTNLWKWFEAVYLLWAKGVITAEQFRNIRESAFFYQPQFAFYGALAKDLGIKNV